MIVSETPALRCLNVIYFTSWPLCGAANLAAVRALSGHLGKDNWEANQNKDIRERTLIGIASYPGSLIGQAPVRMASRCVMLEQISTSKSEILDAAAHCFMTLGVDSASVDDIAAQLGSTKGRIYHHFPSKGALLAAVQLRAAGFTHRAVEQLIDTSLPAVQSLDKMARGHIYAVLSSLAYHKVILQTYTGGTQSKKRTGVEQGLQEQLRTGQRQYELLFRAEVARGMAEGSFQERNLTVAVAGLMLILNSPVFWFRPERGASQAFIDTIARDISSMALASLRA